MATEVKKDNMKDSKSAQVKAYVRSNKKLSSDTYRMVLECPQVASKSKPGQFVAVLCGDSVLLRRPFSIAKACENYIELIYKVRGKGTDFMSIQREGKEMNLIGPLGNGFTITNQKSLLVGAGVGVAPIIYLAQELEKQNVEHSILGGFRTFIDIPEIISPENNIVTDDGSSELEGTVNNHIEEVIQSQKPKKIYACGPEVVLEHCVQMAEKYELEVELALEKVFACGIGVCMGCVIEVRENGQIVNKRICKDGPVFEGRTIVW